MCLERKRVFYALRPPVPSSCVDSRFDSLHWISAWSKPASATEFPRIRFPEGVCRILCPAHFPRPLVPSLRLHNLVSSLTHRTKKTSLHHDKRVEWSRSEKKDREAVASQRANRWTRTHVPEKKERGRKGCRVLGVRTFKYLTLLRVLGVCSSLWVAGVCSSLSRREAPT